MIKYIIKYISISKITVYGNLGVYFKIEYLNKFKVIYLIVIPKIT